jgi:Zn-dependent M16 (insulinase) family peptidase
MFKQHPKSLPTHRGGVPVEAPDLVGIDVQRRVLDNGLICFTATGPNAKRFFGSSIFTPARSSNGEQHVLEHMIVSGSKKFPDPNIYTQTHATSDSSPGACTFYNRTWYYGSSLSDAGLKTTASMLLDGMFNPVLSLKLSPFV